MAGQRFLPRFIHRPPHTHTASACLQIQADLGFGHEHVIKAYEAVLTPSHLCLGGRVGAEGGSGLCTGWLVRSGAASCRPARSLTLSALPACRLLPTLPATLDVGSSVTSCHPCLLTPSCVPPGPSALPQ